MWIGLNNRDKAWHDLYELNLETGKMTLLRENKDRIDGWTFDWDENVRLATRSNENGSFDILRVDADKLTPIYQTPLLESAYTVAFTPDNKQVYLVTNKSKERNFSELLLLNPETSETVFVEKDPLSKVDFENAVVSEKSRALLYTSYVDTMTRYYFKDKAFAIAMNSHSSQFSL